MAVLRSRAMTTPPTLRKDSFVMENVALVPKPCRVELSRVVLPEKPNKKAYLLLAVTVDSISNCVYMFAL